MSEQTKNRIFWIIFIGLILYAIVATYLRVYVNKDYLISNEVSCDPAVESCFVWSPEEECEESEDPNCLAETEPWVYKIIYKKAANIPFCEYDPELGEECPELVCTDIETEEECYYELCEENCAVVDKETFEEDLLQTVEDIAADDVENAEELIAE
jgi:hypothetical protein